MRFLRFIPLMFDVQPHIIFDFELLKWCSGLPGAAACVHAVAGSGFEHAGFLALAPARLSGFLGVGFRFVAAGALVAADAGNHDRRGSSGGRAGNFRFAPTLRRFRCARARLPAGGCFFHSLIVFVEKKMNQSGRTREYMPVFIFELPDTRPRRRQRSATD